MSAAPAPMTVNELHRAMTLEQRTAAMDLIDTGRPALDAYRSVWDRAHPPRLATVTPLPPRPGAVRQATSKPPRLSQVTAADLQHMTFPPVSYVVPGYVAEGLTLLAGKPKLGKSWLALDWCIAVARGAFVFGDIKCPEGDVLYAALEDNPRRLQSRLRKVCQDQPWPPRLTFWTEMASLKDGGLDAIRAWAESRTKPRLIVIDVLNKVRTARAPAEDAYAYDYKSVTPLKELADELGLALIVVHHTRKMAADDQLEAVSGTNGLTGAADTIMVLNRGAEGVTLYARGRDIEEVDVAVQFSRDNCRWSVLGQADEVKRSDERTAILDALREATEPMSSRDIADVTDQADGAVRRLLAKMARSGEVGRPGRGRYTLPDIYPGNNGNSGNKWDDEEDEA